MLNRSLTDDTTIKISNVTQNYILSYKMYENCFFKDIKFFSNFCRWGGQFVKETCLWGRASERTISGQNVNLWEGGGGGEMLKNQIDTCVIINMTRKSA